jgi:RNA polymerase sigma factor (sigma-70 family)
MPVAEDTWTTLAIEGDGAALRKLLEPLIPQLRRHLEPKIRRIHQAAFDADEVIQITFVEAFLRIGQFTPDGPDAFRVWLFKIADNNLKDAVRSIERRKRPPRDRQLAWPAGDDSYVDLMMHLGGTQTTPSEHAARVEAKAAIETALTKLPPDYAAVVRLCDLEGMSTTEAGKVIGKREGAVYMIKTRAHTRLQELLASSISWTFQPVPK